MAFQFPANPTLGQVFEITPGVSYKWNGTGWTPVSPSYFGGMTFTGPVLFPDGSLAAPSIAFANETDTGFYRGAPNVLDVAVDGTHIMQFTKTGIGVSLGAYFAQGASFAGNVTGITAAMVGLGNVVNNQQVWNFAPHNGSIQMAWDGSALQYALNGGGGSTTWPINITGQARTMYTPEGVSVNFRWAIGANNAPYYVWGNDNSGEAYVYSTSSLSVGRASTCGTADNSNAVSGVSGWSYSDWGNNPAYLWATEGGSNAQHLTRPQHLHVYYSAISNGARGVFNAGSESNTRFIFHWHDPGWQLNYLWGSNDGTNMYLQNRGGMNVNYANSCDYSNRTGSISGSSCGGWISGDINCYNNVKANQIFTTSSTGMDVLNTGAQKQFLIIANPSWGRVEFCSIHNSGWWAGFGIWPGGNWFEFRNDGQACKAWAGQWEGTSDIRLKQNVRPLDYGLAEVLKLQPILFELIDRPMYKEEDDPTLVGLSAQDAQLAMPRMVYREVLHDRPELGEVLGVRPDYVQYAMVNAIKELNERLTALENAP